MAECPVCGETIGIDEEWRLKPGVVIGTPVQPGDYLHKDCLEDYDVEG